MVTLIEWLQRALASLGLKFRRESAENEWVEPGNAITRTILAGTTIEIPAVEPSPLAPVTAETLSLGAFEDKPIPPLGVEPPLIRPLVAPDWEAPIPHSAAAEAPRPKVAEQAPPPSEQPTAEGKERKKRRWWRAA